MNKISILVIVLSISINAVAQSNFHKMSVGVGAGYTHAFADVQKHDFDLSAYCTLDYHFTPFLSVDAEIQRGQIVGLSDTDVHGRQFVNSYLAATINGKLALGGMISFKKSSILNLLKDLYVGAGAGVIHNEVTRVKQKLIRIPLKPYVFPGRDSSNDIVFPFNLGLNIFLKSASRIPRLAININMQSNLTIGEGLDGYEDPPDKFKNGAADLYNYYSIGIRYQFGTLGIYHKSLY